MRMNIENKNKKIKKYKERGGNKIKIRKYENTRIRKYNTN